MEKLIKKMVISEGRELRSLVRNGERSGSREAEERWCWRERVFEWAAFKRCLNKCSRAFTKSGYRTEARWRSAVSKLEWTLNAAKAPKQHRQEKSTRKVKFDLWVWCVHGGSCHNAADESLTVFPAIWIKEMKWNENFYSEITFKKRFVSLISCSKTHRDAVRAH